MTTTAPRPTPKHLQATDVSTPLRPGIPKELFSHMGTIFPIRVLGDRFLLSAPPERANADATPVTVVLNVTATLKR